MSSRKSSLRIDRTMDLIDFRNSNFEKSRQRKNSSGANRVCLEQIHSNMNIKLDEKLTAKFLFMKKLQKLQKQAIKYFYEHRTQQCFQSLQKCLNLLQQKCYFQQNVSNTQQNNFPQHLLYVRYLQCQFKYKLKLYDQSRQYYEKAYKIVSKLSKLQRQKTKEYLLSLEVLNACLLHQQGKYAESIKYIQELQSKLQEQRQKQKYKVNDKILKQISITRIQSLVQMRQYLLVVKLIEKFVNQFTNLNHKQKFKINSLLALAFKHTNNAQSADEVMWNLIQYFKSKVKQQSISSYHETTCPTSLNQARSFLQKSYMFFVQMFPQDLIKAIFITRKWQQDSQASDQSTIALFHLYFNIGDYQQALLQLSQISQNYRKTADDWQCLAQIKQFYGELQAAQHMYSKALQLAKSQQRKMYIQIKLLNISPQELSRQGKKAFQRKLKQNRHKSWIKKVLQKYGEYLSRIGQQERYQKLKKFIVLPSQQPQIPSSTNSQISFINPNTTANIIAKQNINATKNNSFLLPTTNPNLKDISNLSSNNSLSNQFFQTGKFVFNSGVKEDGVKNLSAIKKNIVNPKKIIS